MHASLVDMHSLVQDINGLKRLGLCELDKMTLSYSVTLKIESRSHNLIV